MTQIEDVVTYLEMRERPTQPAPPAPLARLALMRAERPTLSYYRYLYDTVGEPWVWFERRRLEPAALAHLIARPECEIFVLHVGGVPAGFFELDVAPGATELCYFGLVPEFIGHGLGRFFLHAAIEQAWSRKLERLWVHTCTFDHPRALGLYQRAGFSVYARRPVRFEDPRERGILPRALAHPLLPVLAPLDRGRDGTG